MTKKIRSAQNVTDVSFFVVLADDTVASGSPAVSFIIVVSPVGSKLPSSDPAVCSRSKASAVVEAANPSKIKSPRISAT